MIKGKLPVWESVLGEHTNIESFQSAKPLYGFVYMLIYEDGKAYIGKKNFYSVRTYSPLQNGETREGHLGFLLRPRRERVKKESKWKTYVGSHKECKNRKPVKRIIISVAYDKKHLTYLEAKALFANNALENENLLNNNILGKFFKKDFLHHEANL